MAKYTIETELGRGGFAVVYRAFDEALGRRVALKILHEELEQGESNCARFIREIEVLAQLRHANIVRVYDTGRLDGRWYYAMELLEARALFSIAAQSRGISPRRALAIAGQVADALAYCHAQGCIHRDIKPSNVMVDAGDHATLMDFGIVRLANATRLTTDGGVMGTPRYLPPEGLEGREVGAPGDVYALGLTLHESISGQTCFPPSSFEELIHRILTTGPVPLAQLKPGLPAVVVDLVGRMTHRDPARRPTAEALKREIDRVLADPRWDAAGKDASRPGVPRVEAAQGARMPAGESGSGVAVFGATPPAWIAAAAGLAGLLVLSLALVLARASLPGTGSSAAPIASGGVDRAVAQAGAGSSGPSGVTPDPDVLRWVRKVLEVRERLEERSAAWASISEAMQRAPLGGDLEGIVRDIGPLLVSERRDLDLLMHAAEDLDRPAGGAPPAAGPSAPAVDVTTPAGSGATDSAGRLAAMEPAQARVWLRALDALAALHAWSRLSRFGVVDRAVRPGLAAGRFATGIAMDVSSQFDAGAYGPEGVRYHRRALDALADALDGLARTPPRTGAPLADLLWLEKEAGGTLVITRWPRELQARVDVQIEAFRSRLDRLGPPLGPLLGRVAGAVWEWGAEGSLKKKTHDRLRDGLAGIEALGQAAPGLAADLFPLERAMRADLEHGKP